MLESLLSAVPDGEKVIVLTCDAVFEESSDGSNVSRRHVPVESLSSDRRLPVDCHVAVVLDAVEDEFLKGRVTMEDMVSVFIDSPVLTTSLRGRVSDFLLPRLDDGTLGRLPSWLSMGVLRDVLMVMFQLRSIPKHRRVGSMLIIGDAEEILPLSVKCDYITFDSIAEEQRHIRHPGAQELIRKIASIDHVYMVDRRGYLVAMLEYIFPPGGPRALGLGSRHTSAAALSANCDVVVFTVQGSTGTIRAYHAGDVALQV